MKPSSTPSAVAACLENPPKMSNVKESQATRLIRLVSDLELFHSPHLHAYATVDVAGHQETYPIRSKGFRAYLNHRFYLEHSQALSSKALQDTVGTLESQALYSPNEHKVFCRIGELDGNVYIDLGSGQWDAIEITREGWAVTPSPPVKFRRARGVLPIPHPLRHPDGGANLAELINVRVDNGDLLLITAWELAAMFPKGPFPVLVLNGEHGSGKTTLSRILRSLLDPNEAPLRAQPRDERDFMIAASNSWMIGLDNLSYLPDWLSDALCRLSTGGGFATRELYTDEEEVLFNVQRPIIMNGIEELATRGDLMDRAIVIEPPQMPRGKRTTEKELWLKFDRYRPGILGYFLDAACCALSNLGQIELPELPRMADFAELILAAEPSLGWPAGAFLNAYGRNREEATEVAIDASLVARLLLNLGSWSGTATQLMTYLDSRANEQERKSRSWPKSPRGLSNAIRRLLPLLRETGLEVTFERETETRNRERMIVLKTLNRD